MSDNLRTLIQKVGRRSDTKASATLRHGIRELGHQFDAEDEAANDLWSWLPSHKAAEKYHGDHAFNFQPPAAEVMKEAAMFIAHKLAPTAEQIKAAGEWYECPCGELHEVDDTEDAEV